jgi:esterase/lipase superfamily enzyme
MPRYWMITNRNVSAAGLGKKPGGLRYFVSDSEKIEDFASWESVGETSFRKMLVDAADQFPAVIDPALNEQQRHVTLFVHGYNNTWAEAAKRYQGICKSLFAGPTSLGVCVLFTWPSDGLLTNYLPDRMDAEKSAPELAEVLNALYDHLIKQQVAGAADPSKGCHAKTSLIAHSMGNFVLQKAMKYAWTRNNQPLLVSLVNQLVMVAADVDNDLFGSGESQDGGDGDAIANLTYRITALYSGMDSTLGASAGLKHFGKRRLGRSGLDKTVPKPDNVWHCDCSPLFKANQGDVHSAYFSTVKTMDLMREVLRGADRDVLLSRLGMAGG